VVVMAGARANAYGRMRGVGEGVLLGPAFRKLGVGRLFYRSRKDSGIILSANSRDTDSLCLQSTATSTFVGIPLFVSI
jgi:hypothetical protein